MAIRYYRNGPATTLVASVGSADTAITVADAGGFPTSTPYTLILDEGLGTEEVVDVTAVAGAQLTITRGVDSTTAFPHSAGSGVVHGISARDPREANTHVNATGAVHGVTGSLVGTTDTQTVSNKTIQSSTFIGAINNSTIGGASTYNARSVVANAETTTTVPLTITGATSQTGDLVKVQKSDATNVFGISALGRLGINTGGPGSTTSLWVKASDPGDTTIRVTAQSGQSSPLIVTADSSNAQTGSIMPDGTISFNSVSSADFNTWASYVPTFIGHNGIVTSTGRWRRIGRKTVAFNAMANFSGAGSGTNLIQFSLPTTPRRDVRQYFGGHSENPGAALSAVIFTGGSGTTVDRILWVNATDTHNAIGTDIGATTILTISGVYEEA